MHLIVVGEVEGEGQGNDSKHFQLMQCHQFGKSTKMQTHLGRPVWTGELSTVCIN